LRDGVCFARLALNRKPMNGSVSAAAFFRTPWGAALLFVLVGCHQVLVLHPPSAPCRAPLNGEVCDVTGDALPDRRLRHPPPDLVRGIAEVQAGSVAFTVRFAPGTFDPATTLILIYLDTDEKRSTGIVMAGGLGVDYNVSASAQNGGHVEKYDGRWMQIGTVATTVVADGIDVTVPLSLIGNPDGRLNYRISSFIVLPNTTRATGVIVDTMPDVNLPPGRVQWSADNGRF
jgi:hypothetical protein